MLCFNTGCVHAETQGKIKHNNSGRPSRLLGRVNQGHFVASQPGGERTAPYSRKYFYSFPSKCATINLT
jgi:hypothetical protein